MSNEAPQIRFKGFTDAWEQRKLGEVCIVTMGQSPDGKNYTDNPNDHILVQGNADMKDGKVHPRVWTTQVTKIARAGDIILSVRAPVGDVGKTDYDIVLGRGVAGINGNEFVYQILLAMKENAFWVKLSTGSTFESINSIHIKDSLINVPASEEQIAIGNFFHTLDNLITLHKRKLDSLKQLKMGYLQNMFPQTEENEPKVRFSRLTEPWEVKKIGEVVESEIKGKAKAEMIGFESIYLDARYLNGGERFYVNALTDVEAEDVLILWDGSQAGTVYHGFTGALGSTLKAYKPKYSGSFLYQQLKKNQQKIYDSYRTPNIPHVVKTFTDEFEINLPTIEEQQKIGNFFRILDEQITIQKTKLDKLKQIKTAYLQKMFV